LSTHTGASALTTAVSTCARAVDSAEPDVVQPPQVNPTIANATAPPTMPHRAGLVWMGMFMEVLSGWRDGTLDRVGPAVCAAANGLRYVGQRPDEARPGP